MFESHLQTFRVKIEKSVYLRKNFIDVVLKAVDSFKHDILTLCYKTRIVEPVWLTLMTSTEQKHDATVDKFMSCFTNIVNKCETKQSKYFLSVLLTAVLSHTTSWVATVMPSGTGVAKPSYLDKHTTNSLDVLAKCHPYNPLWAQLCDMYGAVSAPRKLTRTIIVGQNANLVVELLYLLTYFLRCSDIRENTLHTEQNTDNTDKITDVANVGNLTRFSGSSWNDTLNDAGTPNSVRSWIDQVSVAADTGDLVNVNNNDDNHDDKLLKSDVGFKVVEPEDDKKCSFTKGELDSMNFMGDVEVSRCYCGYLQKLDSSLSGKNLRNLLKNTDKENLVNLLSNSSGGRGKSPPNNNNSSANAKACRGCRTLEKTIFEQYCDKCKEILNNLSLEIDSVCNYCVRHLEKLREMIDKAPSNTDSNTASSPCKDSNIKNRTSNCPQATNRACRCKVSVEDITSVTRNDKPRRNGNSSTPSSHSFKCYCCPLDNSKQTEFNQIPQCEVAIHDDNYLDTEFISRERKASDPVDFTPSPKIAPKCAIRHSTTSHDSGTEMACSVTSSCPETDCSTDSLNLTRDSCACPSNRCVCSRDNLYSSDTIVGDMDSDYCSVDNDRTSTMSSEAATFDTDTMDVIPISNAVCKSTSSTTIKEIYISLESPVDECEDPTTTHTGSLDNIKLEAELHSMNLKEVILPRTVQTSARKTTSNDASTAPDLSSLGSSLIGGYCDSYVSDFVLHGTEKLNEEKLATDLQNSIKYSVLDEQVTDASCVVANTDNWTCEVWNLGRRTDSDRNTCESLTRKPILASGLISSMIESTKELCDLEMPAKFCLLHLEEQLKDIYNRSKVLGEYAFTNTKEDTSSFIKSLSYRANDMELLKSVCVSHLPQCEQVLSS